MRRNLRLTLVLVFLYAVYLLILTYNGTWTLRSRSPHSVSELTDHFTLFVPTKVQTPLKISIRAANADIIQPATTRIKDRLKIAQQNSKISIRSNIKVRPSVKDRTKRRKRDKIQRHPKFGKWKKIGRPEVLRARIRRHTSAQVYSRQKLENNSKAEIYRNPSEGSGLNNARDVHNTLPKSREITELRVRNTSFVTLSSVLNLNLTKTQVFPRKNGNRNKVHTQLKSRITTFEIRNMSEHVRTGVKNFRSASKNTSRKRVIVVAHGRSGSSFFGGIFNAHPDFFFMYEPLNQLKSIVHQNADDYLYGAAYVIQSLLKCNFKDDAFLQKISRQGHHRASSRPLVSPPFCKTTYEKAINFAGYYNWKLCNENISANVLNKICRKHRNIASKILLESLAPADLTWILDVSSSYPVPTSTPGYQSMGDDGDAVSVLYLVRDPRAMIYSRYRLGWVVPHLRHEYGLQSGEAEEAVKKLCDTIEVNLGAVLLYPQHIKLVRYEELVSNPEAMVKRLFRELGISPSKNVFNWIYNKTHGPVIMHALSLSRNATVSINAWRKKIPDKLLEIVEIQCERVMKYLGYLQTNGSQNILRDLRKPLHLNKIRSLKDSYHSSVI